jgi:ethanolamine utilization protein EutJ
MPTKNSANERIDAFDTVFAKPAPMPVAGPLYTGVDLGTAYIVTAVVDRSGVPVAGALTRSRSTVRDGLVLDYLGAIAILKQQVAGLRNAGFALTTAAAAYPPGTSGRNAGAFGHVLEAVDLEVAMLTDEPTAAAAVLGIGDGAVVDIGGGTTGISIFVDGQVVYTADEPTGGTHVDLVLGGHFRVAPHVAEKMKRDPDRQSEVFQVIRPVFQKMASIVRTHLSAHPVKTIYLVGGTSCFPGIDRVMAEETGLEVILPSHPLLVTPLGIAYSLYRQIAPSLPLAPERSEHDTCRSAAIH